TCALPISRGYPFYALGGNETLWLQAAYHFPILPDISRQALFVYFDKLYGRLYADAALAWSGAWPGLGELRRDLGAELRLGLGSFYLLPTSLFVSATYGIDSFDFRSEEHTSELQSRENLVCRLLLEKNKPHM